jgi:cell division protein FtsN
MTMKRIILAVLTIALLTSGCKVFKSNKSKVEPVKTENATETKVFSVPAPEPAVRQNPVSDTMYESPEKTVVKGTPVSVKTEKITMTPEDQANYGTQKFFVIVGSFSSNDNAGRFKQELIQQGFKPIILHSETGYYRVCVDSFNDEAYARSRVQKVRTDYPKYADCWLLIKK